MYVFLEYNFDETAYFGAGMNYRRELKLIPSKLDTIIPECVKSLDYNKKCYYFYFSSYTLNKEMINRFMENLRDDENLVVNFYTDYWEIIYLPVK